MPFNPTYGLELCPRPCRDVNLDLQGLGAIYTLELSESRITGLGEKHELRGDGYIDDSALDIGVGEPGL